MLGDVARGAIARARAKDDASAEAQHHGWRTTLERDGRGGTERARARAMTTTVLFAIAAIAGVAAMRAEDGRGWSARSALGKGARGKSSRGAAYEGMGIDLSESEEAKLKTWMLKKSSGEAALGSVFRAGALREEGAWNPLLHGDVERASARDDLTVGVPTLERKNHRDEGVLGNMPAIFEAAADAGAETGDVASVGVGAASSGTSCDMNKCGDNFQMHDPSCAQGGLGCVGTSGCRFCRVIGREKEALTGTDTKNLPVCNSCVCEARKFSSGCAGMAQKHEIPDEPKPVVPKPFTPTPEGPATPTPKPTEPATPTQPVTQPATPTQPATQPLSPVPPVVIPKNPTPIDNPTPAQSIPIAAAKSSSAMLGLGCKWDLCRPDQMYDPRCVKGGGYGCVGSTGCRFCKNDRNSADHTLGFDKNWETCAQCVCDKHGITGCSGGTSAPTPSMPTPAPTPTPTPVTPTEKSEPTAKNHANSVPWSGVAQKPQPEPEQTPTQPQPEPEQTPTQPQPEPEQTPTQPEQTPMQPEPEQTPAPVDDGVNDHPERFAAAGMGAMQESGPVQPLPVPHRITREGIEWVETKFGALQSCTDACQEISKTCADHVWPGDMNAFRDVLSRASLPNDENVVTCNEILLSDETDHCGAMSRLSGRCFLSPARGHLPASCGTAQKHSDCSSICPCH